MWHDVLLGYQAFVITYFTLLNLLYGVFTYLGIRSIVVTAREVSQIALKDYVERQIYRPVSILVPAHNEQEGVVVNVRSFLALDFPDFEVIVVSDGSTDATVERLTDAFDLVEDDRVRRQIIETQAVHRFYRSLRHPNLQVVDKERGGKADALNAALNLARFPLICAVDADSSLKADAILRASRLFIEDDTLVAVGGTVRPRNSGSAAVSDLPRRWMERFQVLEYARSFFVGRAAWSHFGTLLIISGAFGVFKREAVERVGGFLVGTVGEDVELVFRLHAHYRRAGLPYRMVFTPDPICLTEVPADLATLRRQRNRWQRGLWEAFWLHRNAVFNPRYGRLGLVALPGLLVFEAIAPLVEVSGYVGALAMVAFGVAASSFTILFLALAVLYGMLLSQAAVGIETLLLGRYPLLRDRMTLIAAAFLEFAGYRQLLTLERAVASFQVARKRGQWGEMRRQSVVYEPKTVQRTTAGLTPGILPSPIACFPGDDIDAGSSPAAPPPFPGVATGSFQGGGDFAR